jgi:hypothetical protein
MATDTIKLRCRFCKKDTKHIKKSISHGLHFILTCITVGTWFPIWVIIIIMGLFRSVNNTNSQCSVCGASR